MLTCIINQLDFRAGTRGAAFCIPSGRDNVAKPITNKESGLTTAPTKFRDVVDSKIKVITVIPQVKNSNDSYKLLSGK